MEDLQLQAPKFWYLTLAGPIVSALVTAANTSVSKVILLTVIESIHMIFELIVFLVIGSVSATFASKCQQHISNVDRSVLVSSGNALLDQYQGLKSGFQFGLFLMLTSKTAILTLQVKYFIKMKRDPRRTSLYGLSSKLERKGRTFCNLYRNMSWSSQVRGKIRKNQPSKPLSALNFLSAHQL